MVTKKIVVWTEKAEIQLEEIYQHIKENSIQNAENVKEKIFSSTHQLSLNPEKFNTDKYR